MVSVGTGSGLTVPGGLILHMKQRYPNSNQTSNGTSNLEEVYPFVYAYIRSYMPINGGNKKPTRLCFERPHCYEYVAQRGLPIEKHPVSVGKINAKT